MSPETVMSLSHHAMIVALMLASPMLLVALAVGLLVSLFQAATQINEMTLSFIPKILGVVVVVVVAGPWMMSVIVDYTVQLFHSLPTLVH
ncbi:MAG TPA: flagellar biosynthesis protein FliQ [Rhodanobacteraceae bacterium]|nr:flagellar biosynthesis protein FliQ [Rhodanobacteraceae bacterium]